LTFEPIGDGRKGPSLMTLATLLVNVAQLIVGIIALGILIRDRE
jgi:hypothetical protein